MMLVSPCLTLDLRCWVQHSLQNQCPQAVSADASTPLTAFNNVSKQMLQLVGFASDVVEMVSGIVASFWI